MIYVRVVVVWLSCLCGLLFQQKYSKAWDKKLNDLLDNHEIEREGRYCVEIGGFILWVSNRYYAYGHPYGMGVPEVRPSIKTMIRLSDEIEKSLFK